MPLNSRLPLFGFCSQPISRLHLAIATATLLSACSTVTPPSSPGESSTDLFNSRSMLDRDSAARVLIAPAAPVPVVYGNVWERIADGHEFSDELNNERIDRQLAFYMQNTLSLQQVSESAAPFIFEIVEELERRGMPTELALLPIVESSYNPNASNSGSVGLWQIMNTTATVLGLTQDWWYDARRDPLASTQAALDYLNTLYEMFDHDWPLALAAYNAGPGTVQRAIEHNRARSLGTDYWSLNLPTITENFVPRLIAISRMFASPENYDLELSDVKNEAVLAEVDAGTQIDLNLAANLAGVDSEVIYQLNPGYRQWATHPDGPHTLLLPLDKAEIFTSALANLGENERVTWDRYQVQSGDTLIGIAKRFRTQVNALQRANNISGSRIIAGEFLLIPRAYDPSQPLLAPNAPEYTDGIAYSSELLYQVKSGDSLARIARRYGVSVEALAEWNEISLEGLIHPGQELTIRPEQTSLN